MVVCLYLIQIHISERIWTKRCTHLPLRLGEIVGLCMVRKCLTFFYLFDLRMERVQNPGHNMPAGARHFRYSVISVIIAGVNVTSRSRRHLPRAIRDSVISVILAGVTVTSRKWRSSRRHLPRVIRDSVISVILAGVSVTSRKWRSGRHLRVFYWKCRALWVMHKNAVKWTECMCVKMETWWDRKQVNKELQLQLLR